MDRFMDMPEGAKFSRHQGPNKYAELANLQAEQRTAQLDKFQGRLMGEYNKLAFPGRSFVPTRGSAVADFIAERTAAAGQSIPDVLEALHRRHPDQPARWADMQGGRALAMRELAANPDLSSHVLMTNVDLFDYDLEGLTEQELTALETHAPGTTNPESKPELILANAQSVQLAEPADLITNMEGLQYLDDPVAAICNWYNNLAPEGLLIVASEHMLTDWMAYEDSNGEDYRMPRLGEELVPSLSRQGAEMAVTKQCDGANGNREDYPPEGFKVLVMQRRAGTRLVPAEKPADILVARDHHKTVCYPRPAAGNHLINVVEA